MRRTDEMHWQRWRDFAHSARIMRALGVKVPSLRTLNVRLNRSPNIRKRKIGTAQSSPTWYRVKRRSK
jgi:hypothetical protein